MVCEKEIGKLNFIKVKIFCSMKVTIKRMKRQTTDEEQVLIKTCIQNIEQVLIKTCIQNI